MVAGLRCCGVAFWLRCWLCFVLWLATVVFALGVITELVARGELLSWWRVASCQVCCCVFVVHLVVLLFDVSRIADVAEVVVGLSAVVVLTLVGGVP